MSFIASIFAAAVAVAQAAGSAAAPSVAAPPAQMAAIASATKPIGIDDDKVVCKSIAVTGTRFPTKICATKGQWAQRTQDGRDYADNMTKLGRNCGVGGGC